MVIRDRSARPAPAADPTRPPAVVLWAVLLGSVFAPAAAAEGLRFALSLPAERSAAPLDGRMLLLISTDGGAEPRFQVDDRLESQQVFGLDVEGLAPGKEAVFGAAGGGVGGAGVAGYPLASLAEIPPGEYWVQGLLHRYETFHRADGHVVELPMDRGEGQQWNEAPGNLYSAPRRLAIDPRRDDTVRIVLDREIPPVPPPADTRYVKHLRIESPLLSAFWGRPMHLGAVLLLPAGFDEHPEARYPLAIFHGHFAPTFGGFREEPPDPDLPAPDWAWLRANCRNGHHPDCDAHGYARIKQEYAHRFYRAWTGPDFPRVIIVTIQHANPYYDDSYAVNSANLGPYGDAITRELIPAIEERYRGLGPWARALYGGSTGGWEALAAQVLYPDDYNGAFAACPDPIDFRAYTAIDLYRDRNAYYAEGEWRRVPRPGHRDWLGRVSTTVEAMNRLELALGTRSRSGRQWDAWQAVYSPVGEDGYPRPIWDKVTGVVDPVTAAYWRERYDLGAILARDWPTLGPKLRGKLHLYTGDTDSYYLNDAVYLVEEFLAAADPPADAEVRYGDRHEHCWSGDPDQPNFISRLTYHQRFLPRMVERWLATAPPGADVASWRY
jgi:hypothetical protein